MATDRGRRQPIAEASRPGFLILLTQKIKTSHKGSCLTLPIQTKSAKVMSKISFDKWLHFIVSLFLAIILSTLMANALYNFAPNDPGTRSAVCYGAALFVTLAIGVCKELGDRKQAGNHFCWYDLAADAIGAVLGSFGAFVSYLI